MTVNEAKELWSPPISPPRDTGDNLRMYVELKRRVSFPRPAVVRDLSLAGLRRGAARGRRGGAALRRGRQPARARLVAPRRRAARQVSPRPSPGGS